MHKLKLTCDVDWTCDPCVWVNVCASACWIDVELWFWSKPKFWPWRLEFPIDVTGFDWFWPFDSIWLVRFSNNWLSKNILLNIFKFKMETCWQWSKARTVKKCRRTVRPRQFAFRTDVWKAFNRDKQKQSASTWSHHPIYAGSTVENQINLMSRSDQIDLEFKLTPIQVYHIKKLAFMTMHFYFINFCTFKKPSNTYIIKTIIYINNIILYKYFILLLLF